MSSVGNLEVPSSFPAITTSLSASTLDLPQKVAGNINRERSPSVSGRPRASSLEPGSLYQCSECKYMTNSKQRYDKHFKQPRHVNFYRDRAYKEPKKRQVWLKVWFSQLEAAELENYDAFEVAEEHEEEETVINEDEVFRLPTASDYADVLTVDRKISSSSTCSTASFQSNVSTYE
eukprot:12496.XXX_828528_829304_1 [CDS] Oithona nana genome sequencing.